MSQMAIESDRFKRISNNEDLSRNLGNYIILDGTLLSLNSKDGSVMLANSGIFDEQVIVSRFDQEKYGSMIDQRVTLVGKISRVPARNPMAQGRGEHYLLEFPTLQDGTPLYKKDAHTDEMQDPFGAK